MTREKEEAQENANWLLEKSQVRERPFTSNTPLVGPLLVRFREAWNSIATKWYVRPLLQQQNSFNQIVVSQLHEHDQWFILQDREQTELAHDLAQMSTYLSQISHRLQVLEDHLAQLEAQQPD
ncbi:MAG: hypothetical protein H6657_11760 [Ardenticatenaceae bacterium]|nr:hypothetical protein [Ardenticatenaceae bacterium]